MGHGVSLWKHIRSCWEKFLKFTRYLVVVSGSVCL